MYIEESLPIKIRNYLSSITYKSKFLESTFAEITLPKQTNIIVGCIYKHPVLSKTDFTETYLGHQSLLLNILISAAIESAALIEGGTYLETQNLAAALIRGRGLLEKIRYAN